MSLDYPEGIYGERIHQFSLRPLILRLGAFFVPPSGRQFPRPVNEVDDFYILPQGGSVMVKLREAITLPANMGGILLPKNGHFASKGLLITNFGHVDPGFKGYLKCTVINFGQDDYMLEIGKPIACLLLFRLDEDAYPDWSTSNRHGEQDEMTHAKVLSQHFANIPDRIEAITTDKVARTLRSRDRAAFWGPIFTTLFALLGIAVTMGIYLVSWNDRWTTLNTTVSELRYELQALKNTKSIP